PQIIVEDPAQLVIVGAGDPRAEAEKFQGTWAVVAADGLHAPEEALQRLKVVIRGETLRILAGDREREKATFQLDPSQRPKAIDLTKDPKGPLARGIYELDGDTLKLVWRSGGPRPTAFPTTRQPRKFTGGPSEDDGLRMVALKQEKSP